MLISFLFGFPDIQKAWLQMGLHEAFIITTTDSII